MKLQGVLKFVKELFVKFQVLWISEAIDHSEIFNKFASVGARHALLWFIYCYFMIFDLKLFKYYIELFFEVFSSYFICCCVSCISIWILNFFKFKCLLMFTYCSKNNFFCVTSNYKCMLHKSKICLIKFNVV